MLHSDTLNMARGSKDSVDSPGVDVSGKDDDDDDDEPASLVACRVEVSSSALFVVVEVLETIVVVSDGA